MYPSAADASPKGVNICMKEGMAELPLDESRQRAAKVCARARGSAGCHSASVNVQGSLG